MTVSSRPHPRASATRAARLHPEPNDVDGDEILNVDDNCPTAPNGSQLNTDLQSPAPACRATPSATRATPTTTTTACPTAVRRRQLPARLQPRPGGLDPGRRPRRCLSRGAQRQRRHQRRRRQLRLRRRTRTRAISTATTRATPATATTTPTATTTASTTARPSTTPTRPTSTATGSAASAMPRSASPDRRPVAGRRPARAPGAQASADRTAPAVTVSVARRQRLADTGRALVVEVTCSEACGLDAVVAADARSARRARLGGGRVVAARGSWSLAGAGRTYVFARWSATARAPARRGGGCRPCCG